jgi:hypothetical protein
VFAQVASRHDGQCCLITPVITHPVAGPRSEGR